jgi:hypothetical protein
MRVVTELPCASENRITIALQYRLADSLEGLLKSAYYIQYDTYVVNMKHQDHTLSTEPWLVDVAKYPGDVTHHPNLFFLELPPFFAPACTLAPH